MPAGEIGRSSGWVSSSLDPKAKNFLFIGQLVAPVGPFRRLALNYLLLCR